MGIRIYTPTEAERDKVDALRDQSERFLELVELGALTSLEDAIGYFRARAVAYGHIRSANKWIMDAEGLMDQQATIEKERQRQERKAAREQQQQTPKGGDQDTERDH